MVSVGNGAHSVDLEVLVGTDAGDGFNGSPVGEARLSIIEPVVGEVLHVVGVVVGNAGGNLRSVDTSASRDQLGANLLVNSLVRLDIEERVPEVVSATNNLNIIQVVTVNGGQASTAVVHLSGEDLVTEEVVTKDAAIGVGEVVGLGHSDIGQVTEEGVHAVVLLLNIIEMLGVLVNSVGAKHVLEEHEGVEVLVLHGGSIVEDSNVGVVHLVITDEHEGRNVDSLIHVLSDTGGGLGDRLEGVVNLINESGVIDVTSSDDDKVVTEVVGSLVSGEVLHGEGGKLISVTLDGLAEHVVSVGVEVSVFKGGVLEIVLVVSVISGNLLLKDLELSLVEGGVSNGVTED